MPIQNPKKSSSLAHYGGATHNKTSYCDIKSSYDNKLYTSKSVHAFRQTIPSKHKNHIHHHNRTQRQLLQNTTNTQRYGSVTNRKYYDNNGNKGKTNINSYNNYNNNNNNNNKSSVQLSTGQCYKQAIEKRKKKSLSISSNNNMYKNKSSSQLLATIDAFQQTLCSLPLDKLILSENPFYWVQQQVKTLQSLREKFFRVQRSLRQETRGYYISKLQNVTRVLINIKDNLQTLTKMTVLKNYNSGGMSLDSRNSHSEEGRSSNNARDKSGLRNFNVVEVSLNGNVSSPHFSIESKNDNKENEMNVGNRIRGNFSKVKMVKSQLKAQQISQHDQFILKDYHHHPSNCTSESSQAKIIINNSRTQKSFKSLSQSESDQQYYHHRQLNSNNSNNNKFINGNRKSCVIQHQQEQEVSVKHNNTQQQKQPSITMMGMRRNQLQSQQNQSSMNKTVSKFHFMHSNQSKHLCQSANPRDSYQQESKETFNTLQNNDYTLNSQSLNTFGQQTKRADCHPISTSQHTYSLETTQQLKRLRQQLTIKNDILLKLQERHVKQIKTLQAQFGRKEKHYLETIYELKTQNEEKEHSIKQLIIQKQEQSEQLQLALRHLKSTIESKKEHSGKQSLLKDSVETLINEINKSKVREDELRETVQLERQRTKKVLRDMQQLQEQLQTINNLLKQKQLHLQQSKTQHINLQNKLQQVMVEIQKVKCKQDIYKMKYFKLYADFDQFKQKVNDNQHYWSKICLYCKKDFIKEDKLADSQKGLQLRELINFHKRTLAQ